MVNRSISSKSFLGVLCLSPSPSSLMSLFRILSSSSSSGVVRNVSESLFGMAEEVPSGFSVGGETPGVSDTPALSDVGSADEKVFKSLAAEKCSQREIPLVAVGYQISQCRQRRVKKKP